jgi:hypothetical protein
MTTEILIEKVIKVDPEAGADLIKRAIVTEIGVEVGVEIEVETIIIETIRGSIIEIKVGKNLVTTAIGMKVDITITTPKGMKTPIGMRIPIKTIKKGRAKGMIVMVTIIEIRH